MPHPITPQERARNATVEANLALVPFFCQQHRARRGWVDWDDIEQEGRLGLLRAAELHDPGRGTFSTYATAWVRVHAFGALSDATGPMRVPIQTHKLVRHLGRADCPRPEHVRAALRVLQMTRRTGEIAAPAEEPDRRAELWEAVAHLPEPDRTVIRLRYGEGLTWRATAARVGGSYQGAQYYAARAIEQLRHDLGVREEQAG